MNIRQSLIAQGPSIALQRAAAFEIAQLDAKLAALKDQSEVASIHLARYAALLELIPPFKDDMDHRLANAKAWIEESIDLRKTKEGKPAP